MEVSLMAKSRRWARAAIMGIAAATIGLGLAACGGGGGGGGPKIALLLPESKTTRYEAHDHPEFESAVKAACSDCDTDLQQRQPGRVAAAESDGSGAHGWRRCRRAGSGGLDVRGVDGAAGEAAERPGRQLRPLWSWTRPTLNRVRLVRQRQGRPAAGRHPVDEAGGRRQRERADRPDQRLAHGQQRQAVRPRRCLGLQPGGCPGRQGVRHA